jgi:hypothetical protein
MTNTASFLQTRKRLLRRDIAPVQYVCQISIKNGNDVHPSVNILDVPFWCV